MWKARTKNDLIIEVWEKLDCENVGAAEIEALETAVADQYGKAAVDSPMTIARLLADEGAELRHHEIMGLYVERASDRPYDAALRNILVIDDLRTTAASIRNMENLRRKYVGENDKEGLRLLRETVIGGKASVAETANRKNVEPAEGSINAEIAQWLTVWLETPEVFDTWLHLRRRSADFQKTFGDALSNQV